MDVQPVEVTTDPDPRARVTGDGPGLRIQGWRCTDCGLSSVEPALRCGGCGALCVPISLATLGVIWSWTVARVGRDSGTAFAYVDLDDGPRVLARLTGDTRRVIGTRVRIVGTTAAGDLEAATA